MFKISVVAIVISSFLLTCCTSWETVQSPQPNSTIKITTNEDKTFEMSKWTEEPDYFEGFAGETKKEGNLTLKYQTKVNKSDIKMIEEQKYDGTKTLWFSIGAVVVTVGLLAIVAVSSISFR